MHYLFFNYITVKGNAMPPIQCQAITWTNADILSTGPLGNQFDEILHKIQTFTWINLKSSSGKCQPLSANVYSWPQVIPYLVKIII